MEKIICTINVPYFSKIASKDYNLNNKGDTEKFIAAIKAFTKNDFGFNVVCVKR
jgi:hypothetical protein